MIAVPFKRYSRYTILLIIAIAILAVSYFRLMDLYELETLDLRFQLRPRIPTTDKVVLIEIGEDTIAKLGRFPFERSYHALLINALTAAGAKSVIFDIFFSEPEEHDRELGEAMRHAGRVYLPFVLDIDMKRKADIIHASGYTARNIEDIDILAKGKGQINIEPDIDGKFRRIPLYIRYGEALYPYISFLATCDYLGIPQKDIKILPGRYLAVGQDLKIPLDDRSNMIINYSGRWGSSYKHYSYADILQSYIASSAGQKPILDLKVFRDKLCVVGLTAAGTTDLHPNPFESLYPGVGIHAEVFNSIYERCFIGRASREANLGILAILSLLISLVTFITKPIKGLLALAAAAFIYITASIFAFNVFGIWIDIFYPMLAMAFIYISITLYKYITEWKKRLVLENELDIARRIQESFLPKKIPAIGGMEIAVSMLTARKVGGDLYDFVESGPDGLGVMIGDVSGKGIPASLFMAMVMGKFRTFATIQGLKPEEVLLNLNSKLLQESSSNLFVTMFYVFFDMKKKVLKFANGGHLPLIQLSEGGKVEFLDVAEGAPLGLMENGYSGGERYFREGDIFVLYTDGITEAMNPRSEMYGKERLASVIEANRYLSSRNLLNAIERDVRKFEPRARQHDDMTLMVIKTA